MGKRGPIPRKGAPTGIRFEPELKADLEAAARQAGRSLAEEISARLKASFGVVEFSNPETKALAALIGHALDTVGEQAGHAWFEHPWAFSHARAAVAVILDYLEPNGELCVPDDHPALRSLRAQGLGDLAAKAKEQLESSTMGKLAGIETVSLIEAVADGHASTDLDHLRPLAELVRAQMVKARTTGAIDDLKSAARKPGSGVKL